MDSRSMTTGAPGADATGSAHAQEMVSHLPYGVIVVEPGGLVSTSNPCARVLPRARGGRRAAVQRAARLHGARRPVRRTAASPSAPRRSETALPEIRIDTSRGGGVSALWVTAAPLGDGRALLHLRPGDARDRRRRSDPHWISGPRLRVSAFGRMHVDSPEGPLGGKWLQQRPGHVLKYLVCERNRVVHAEEIAEALWPGAGPAALNNVRHFIHSLRDKLEPDRPKRAPSSFIVAVQGGYAIDRRRVQIDADDFEESAKKGDRRRSPRRHRRGGGRALARARALPRRLPLRRALRRVGVRRARPAARADDAMPAAARDDPRQARRHRRRRGRARAARRARALRRRGPPPAADGLAEAGAAHRGRAALHVVPDEDAARVRRGAGLRARRADADRRPRPLALGTAATGRRAASSRAPLR